MYNEVSHWIWLAWGLGCLCFMFFIYYVMIKSAQYVTRLYQGNQTLPNNQYHEFGSTTVEKKKNYSAEQSSRNKEPGGGEQNRSERKEPPESP